VTAEDYTYTEGMTEAEIDARLHETKTGVLALARDGEAYAIPVACHYDGDRLVLRLGEHEDSEKMAFVETTERATLVLYEYEQPDESWSVVVRGPIVRLEEDDPTSIENDTDNDFPPIRIFGETIEDVEEVRFELRVDEVTGRQT